MWYVEHGNQIAVRESWTTKSHHSPMMMFFSTISVTLLSFLRINTHIRCIIHSLRAYREIWRRIFCSFQRVSWSLERTKCSAIDIGKPVFFLLSLRIRTSSDRSYFVWNSTQLRVENRIGISWNMAASEVHCSFQLWPFEWQIIGRMRVTELFTFAYDLIFVRLNLPRY